MINTVIQFCYNWYDAKERPMYLSILSITNVLGGGLGNFIPILFVSPSVKDPAVIKNLVLRYNVIVMIVLAVVFILNLLFFKGKPDESPDDKD